jgi:hypothetical protein
MHKCVGDVLYGFCTSRAKGVTENAPVKEVVFNRNTFVENAPYKVCVLGEGSLVSITSPKVCYPESEN